MCWDVSVLDFFINIFKVLEGLGLRFLGIRLKRLSYWMQWPILQINPSILFLLTNVEYNSTITSIPLLLANVRHNSTIASISILLANVE